MRRLRTWWTSIENELGRISQGIPNRVHGMNAINFIKKSEFPYGKTVTYSNMVSDYCPLKDEKYRVRLAVGGDKLPHHDETASPTADLLETKILLNSTISDAHKGARFMGIDIKNFFLMTSLPTKNREYMQIHKKYFSNFFIELYKLQDRLNNDGYVYCEVQLGMYGLKQAAILAYKQ